MEIERYFDGKWTIEELEQMPLEQLFRILVEYEKKGIRGSFEAGPWDLNIVYAEILPEEDSLQRELPEKRMSKEESNLFQTKVSVQAQWELRDEVYLGPIWSLEKMDGMTAEQLKDALELIVRAAAESSRHEALYSTLEELQEMPTKWWWLGTLTEYQWTRQDYLTYLLAGKVGEAEAKAFLEQIEPQD